LITLATAGSGYLNFMGNEFGHPEWIDFPREGNNWSYRYARRQWHLVDDPQLKYAQLNRFDRDMIAFSIKFNLLAFAKIDLLHAHSENMVLVFQRAGQLLAFNFHPTRSYTDYRFHAPPGQIPHGLSTAISPNTAVTAGSNRTRCILQHRLKTGLSTQTG
jgi:1,4-alpha-glucan branching enzyme